MKVKIRREPPDAWWHEYCECTYCHSLISLERGDPVTLRQEPRYSAEDRDKFSVMRAIVDVAVYDCPVCHQPQRVERNRS